MGIDPAGPLFSRAPLSLGRRCSSRNRSSAACRPKLLPLPEVSRAALSRRLPVLPPPLSPALASRCCPSPRWCPLPPALGSTCPGGTSKGIMESVQPVPGVLGPHRETAWAGGGAPVPPPLATASAAPGSKVPHRL
ncbi:hypothetical protein GQ55_5G388200 [Panicum hallii var. hallii]|uniref:Uncharacterized protein n=1 Tax=Panicum hallii var. hallii TaxID=1504633 RepID=A0A2T7DMZ4_9POAL|nr:hypothetical protein GQ55_5G388200 [Panicum hallii var. hallii]